MQFFISFRVTVVLQESERAVSKALLTGLFVFSFGTKYMQLAGVSLPMTSLCWKFSRKS